MLINIIIFLIILGCDNYFFYRVTRKQRLEIELLKEIIKKK